MTVEEAIVQAFENGKEVGDAEGYARGLKAAYAKAGDLISVKEARETAQRIFSDPVLIHAVDTTLKNTPAIAAEPVKHGRWRRSGGDLHSSGYAIYCSVCNKNHFVHYKYSLGGLDGCKELFERPKYCPSCGAIMEEGNDL